MLRGAARPCCARRRPPRVHTGGCWTLRPRIRASHGLLILLAILLVLPLIPAGGLSLALIVSIRHVARIHSARARAGVGVMVAVVPRISPSLGRWTLHALRVCGGHCVCSALVGNGRDGGSCHSLGPPRWWRPSEDIRESLVALARRSRLAVARLRSPLLPRIIVIVGHRQGLEIRNARDDFPILTLA